MEWLTAHPQDHPRPPQSTCLRKFKAPQRIDWSSRHLKTGPLAPGPWPLTLVGCGRGSGGTGLGASAVRWARKETGAALPPAGARPSAGVRSRGDAPLGPELPRGRRSRARLRHRVSSPKERSAGFAAGLGPRRCPLSSQTSGPSTQRAVAGHPERGARPRCHEGGSRHAPCPPAGTPAPSGQPGRPRSPVKGASWSPDVRCLRETGQQGTRGSCVGGQWPRVRCCRDPAGCPQPCARLLSSSPLWAPK